MLEITWQTSKLEGGRFGDISGRGLQITSEIRTTPFNKEQLDHIYNLLNLA